MDDQERRKQEEQAPDEDTEGQGFRPRGREDEDTEGQGVRVRFRDGEDAEDDRDEGDDKSADRWHHSDARLKSEIRTLA